METRKLLFDEDIKHLGREYFKVRLIVATLVLASVLCPLNAVMFPKMSKNLKLINILLGSVFGVATAEVLKKSSSLKIRFEQQQALQKSSEKAKIGKEYAYEQAAKAMKLDLAIANLINKLPRFDARIFFAEKYNVMGLIHADNTIEAQYETIEDTQSSSSGNFALTGTSFQPVTVVDEFRTDDYQWLDDLIGKACLPLKQRGNHHFVMCGVSQSGKTTLTNFLLGLYAQKLDNNVQVVIIDPKNDGLTQWLEEPLFKGFDQVLDGVDFALAEFTRRQQARREDKSAQFSRFILVFDEFEMVFSNGQGNPEDGISPKDAKRIVGKICKLLGMAASFDMSVILLSQSPLTGDLGISRSRIKNATRVCLCQVAYDWIQDPKFPFPHLKSEFEQFYNKANKRDLRAALVCPMKGEGYMRIVPQIDFDALLKGDNDETVISDEIDPLDAVIDWFLEYCETYDHEPDDELITNKWFELKNQTLNEQGLNLLKEKIRQFIDGE